MHHGNESPEMTRELAAAQKRLRKETARLHDARQPGPTGRFPEGRLIESDKGEIQFRIAVVNGKVVMDFGAMGWVGLSATQADQVADSLRRFARDLRDRT